MCRCCTVQHKRIWQYLIVLRIQGADEHVVGDVVQVTSVFEPGPGHRDVVCGALALGLNQNKRIIDGVANGFEWLQNL